MKVKELLDALKTANLESEIDVLDIFGYYKIEDIRVDNEAESVRIYIDIVQEKYDEHF